MFKEILNSLSDGVMVLDQGQKIIYANRALTEIFAVPLNEISGKRPIEVIRLAELSEIIAVASQGTKPPAAEVQLVFPESKTLSINASLGAENRITIVFRDITNIRKLENIRSEFVANVSHELKTPLTAIQGFAQTLLNGALDDKKHNVEFVQKIEKHAVNLSSLIDDLLEISKLEYHRGTDEGSAKIIVSELIDRAIEMIADKAQRKGIKIVVECQAENSIIGGIEEHVFRALLNLLDNAVNYTDSGGNITITCEKKEGSVLISVADNGIGIAAEHLPRLFERFYRIDKGRSRDQGGTGLGLSIVKHVMNLHNGSVSVESQVGKGTKFTLAFPMINL